MSTTNTYESISNENRKFPPIASFATNAHIGSMDCYLKKYNKSIQDPQAYWAEVAEDLHWFKPWDTVLDDSSQPFYKWFDGSRTNLSYNCLDRHVTDGR